MGPRGPVSLTVGDSAPAKNALCEGRDVTFGPRALSTMTPASNPRLRHDPHDIAQRVGGAKEAGMLQDVLGQRRGRIDEMFLRVGMGLAVTWIVLGVAFHSSRPGKARICSPRPDRSGT